MQSLQSAKNFINVFRMTESSHLPPITFLGQPYPIPPFVKQASFLGKTLNFLAHECIRLARLNFSNHGRVSVAWQNWCFDGAARNGKAETRSFTPVRCTEQGAGCCFNRNRKSPRHTSPFVTDRWCDSPGQTSCPWHTR